MSELTISAPSPEARAKLFGALAKLQSNLPKVAKASTADTGTYKYQYAGLDAVTDAAMPALGKYGLAFIALPTLNGAGNFVLSYSLVHEAGGEISGEYPLPDKGSAQQLGSAITYARRYTLTAATGIAPGGEDDDGAAATQAYQHASKQQGERQQQPRPMNQGPRPQGQVSRPAAAGQTRLTSGEADPDAQKYADTASQTRSLAELEQIHKDALAAQKLSALIKAPESGNLGKLAVYIDWRRKLLADLDRAWKELDSAQAAARVDVTELEVIIRQETGVDADHASAAQLFQVAEKLRERAA